MADQDAGETISAEEHRRRGTELLTTIVGAENMARIAERNTIAPNWQRWTTETLFGDLWQGPELTLKQRSTITVAVLVTMTRPRELEIHMRAGLGNGLTIEELVGILQHVGFYAGWPAVGEALTILKKIADEQ